MSRVKKLSEVLLTSPRYVKFNETRVQEVAEILQSYDLEIPPWNFPGQYPQTDDFEELCLYYLIFNSINYCYFDQDGKKFRRDDVSGSTLALACLLERWDEIKDPNFLANVDENYLLSELFAAESPISLVKERTNALREVGEFLNSNLDFTFEKLFHRYRRNAYFVSQALPTHLSTWRDPFFKRSQLFVGMVYGRFQDWEKIPIDSESLEDLTIFADYRVPQTLIAMGILVPSASLLSRLHRNQLLGSGSRKELELRAGSVWGGEVLGEQLRELRNEDNLNALHVDYLLWSAARKKDKLPPNVFTQHWPNHHRTVTTDY